MKKELIVRAWKDPAYRAQLSAEAAARLGLSEAAVKSAIHRLRKRYAELIREEISQTVASDEEVEGEIRHLISALMS